MVATVFSCVKCRKYRNYNSQAEAFKIKTEEEECFADEIEDFNTTSAG